jgi:hypothetical protein
MSDGPAVHAVETPSHIPFGLQFIFLDWDKMK